MKNRIEIPKTYPNLRAFTDLVPKYITLYFLKHPYKEIEPYITYGSPKRILHPLKYKSVSWRRFSPNNPVKFPHIE
jgi:hypothetical protein